MPDVAPPAARAGLVSWASTMGLHPEACASLEISLGQPTGVCGCLAELCAALPISVEIVGRHRGGDLAMGVPWASYPNALVVSISEKTATEGSESRTLKQTGPPLLCQICPILPLSPPGGDFWQERNSANSCCGPGKYMALSGSTWRPPW